jgi:hypothetical protein
MVYLNRTKKKNNAIVKAKAIATTAVVTLVIIIILIVAGTGVIAPLAPIIQSAEAQGLRQIQEGDLSSDLAQRKAPVVVSGDNIYIAWWTNNTENGNQEVMFRASNDAGATFGDKMNLSNTTDADSSRVEIAAEGADVIVTWWETNQTSDTPAARISNDGGQTFGSMLRLGANGTIESTAEAEVAAEAGEEG